MEVVHRSVEFNGFVLLVFENNSILMMRDSDVSKNKAAIAAIAFAAIFKRNVSLLSDE